MRDAEPFRKAHMLDKTYGSDRPSRIIFVDTETNQETLPDGQIRHYLKLGYAQFCRTRREEILRKQDEIEFTDLSTFWKWVSNICKPKTKTYIVCHNVNYDIPVLHAFMYIGELGFELSSWYQKATSGIFQWRRDKTSIIYLDNGNFYQGKLEQWGDKIGVPKLAIDLNNTSDEYLLTYCKRDVQILVELWRIWLQFLDDNDLGGFRYTISSTAMSAFRYRFMQHKIYLHDHNEADALERAAYKGGRVECLFVGLEDKSTYYYLDVNSMYAYVLANYQFPHDLKQYGHGVKIATLAHKLYSNAVIAEVSLNTTDNPFHYFDGKRTLYPTGKFRTTLTTGELQLALECDWITEVHKIAIYSQAYLFRDYANYFYDTRLRYEQAGQDGFAKIAKLFNNGLYGKFGQLTLNQKVVGQCPIEDTMIEYTYDVPNDVRGQRVRLGGSIFEINYGGTAYNGFPAIAAHVTGYARLLLFNFLKQCPPKSAYYMDTDSIIVNQQGYDALKHHLDDHRLGALKIETTSNFIEINAPKDYRMQGREKTKGINKDAIEFEIDKFYQEQWRRLSGMIAKGNVKDYWQYGIVKKLQRRVNSGYPQEDGFVLPFHFD